MRFLRAVLASAVLLALFFVPSAAQAANELEVSVRGAGRQTAGSAVNVTTYAKEKVSAVSVELTVDGRPVQLDGYKNGSSSSFTDWPFTQYWSNGVPVDRPLVDLPAKVSVTYESGRTVVVERVLRPLVDVQISDVAYSPTHLGASHGPVTFTGLVTYKKNAGETVPAPGAKVRVYSDGYNSTTVATGVDGRFTLTTYMHAGGRPRVFVLSERPYSGTFVTGETELDVAKAKTRIRWSAPGQDDIWVGDSLDISGLLEWLAPTGEWLPLGRAHYVTVSCGQQIAGLVTSPDGTFRMTLAPKDACRLTVTFSTSDAMFEPAYGSATPMVRQHAAVTGLTWPKSPVVQGDPFRVTGTYVGLPGNTPLTSGRAELFFSPDNTNWQRVGGQESPDANGVFSVTAEAWADGYWKLEVNGSPGVEPVTLTSPLIKVRKHARFTMLDALPEPVRKGKKLTVRGTLRNSYDNDPVANQKVAIWFRPKASKTWKRLATVATDAEGGFGRAFKAAGDGYWRATYAGDAVYFAATSASDYVDVR